MNVESMYSYVCLFGISREGQTRQVAATTSTSTLPFKLRKYLKYEANHPRGVCEFVIYETTKN